MAKRLLCKLHLHGWDRHNEDGTRGVGYGEYEECRYCHKRRKSALLPGDPRTKLKDLGGGSVGESHRENLSNGRRRRWRRSQGEAGGATVGDPTRAGDLPRGPQTTREPPSWQPVHHTNKCSTLAVGDTVHRQPGWPPGQRILNDAGARMPQHTLDPPVPVVARIVWEDDGEEHLDTEAAGVERATGLCARELASPSLPSPL
jgi:hypothetical protein